MTAPRKPTLDPDEYNPLSSPQFVHPSLIVWRWKAGLYTDLKSAVEDYLFHSVISAARNEGKCHFSCRHIAEKLGVMAGKADDGKTDRPNTDAVWGCVRFSRIIHRTGTQGERGRAWNITGLLEWEEGKKAYRLIGAGLRSRRSNTPNQSEQDSESIGVKLRPHNSEVCVEDDIEVFSEVGKEHPGQNHPPSTPHHTGNGDGGSGHDGGNCGSYSSASPGSPHSPDGCSHSPPPPFRSPPLPVRNSVGSGRRGNLTPGWKPKPIGRPWMQRSR